MGRLTLKLMCIFGEKRVGVKLMAAAIGGGFSALNIPTKPFEANFLPWAFKLKQLHPFGPLLFPKFSNFLTFILGVQFLLPQRANNEKGECNQLQNWTRQRSLSAWGIQTGPLAPC